MSKLIVRQLQNTDYEPVWKAMQNFTDSRNEDTDDELWIVEHPPVFTQGQAGKEEHLLAPGNIPVVPVDRGGQVTYHGPGQLVVYFMLDIRRRKMGVRQLVTAIEDTVVAALAKHGISAAPRPDAPGVYIGEEKVCSLGLRIRKGCSFHGLALNVNMDLSPFSRINPCGYAGMVMTQTSAHGGPDSVEQAAKHVVQLFAEQLSYIQIEEQTGLPERNV
ncbi:lipoate-protein ligase B [Idiomarina sp. A28L]|uniref:lipoyl(octanoyl) transferase LipB n=1 Tax=Idiomarina sp. A28L TaxID=1036674 RepID=UPI00021386B8|nr:lipoyl(octanoyl) transferase LipB [Idiomarina sp. A28L]EGN76380.1 lipoate-protein ligase B [Idiomarina sp. A28L]